MGEKRPFGEERINERLREVTAELRKLRTELQRDIRAHRRETRPFTRMLDAEVVGRVGTGADER
jgi:hypothetical protein